MHKFSEPEKDAICGLVSIIFFMLIFVVLPVWSVTNAIHAAISNSASPTSCSNCGIELNYE